MVVANPLSSSRRSTTRLRVQQAPAPVYGVARLLRFRGVARLRYANSPAGDTTAVVVEQALDSPELAPALISGCAPAPV